MKEKERLKRVPYRERRSVKKYLVPRTLQLRRRKWKNRTLIATLLIAVFILWRLSANLLPAEKAIRPPINSTQNLKEPASETTAIIDLAERPVFVYSLKDGRLGQAAIIAFDRKSSTLTLIFFEEKYHLPMLSLGVIAIQSIPGNFVDEYFCSIKNSFIFPLEGPFKISSKALNPDIIIQSPNFLIEEMKKAGIPFNDIIKAKSAEVVPAPTRLAKVGEKTVIVIDTGKLNEAASIMFSDSIPKKKVRAKVVILNGSGRPAAATAAAVKLIKADFQLQAIRNAERFDYLTTIIKTADEKIGKEINGILNCGEIKITREIAGIADALVIVGKDFRDSI